MFTVDGKSLRRSRTTHATVGKTWAEDPDSGKRRDLSLAEHQAFWALAAVNVLRHTGIRIEELGELSHHSLIHYKLPATGELVRTREFISTVISIAISSSHGQLSRATRR